MLKKIITKRNYLALFLVLCLSLGMMVTTLAAESGSSQKSICTVRYVNELTKKVTVEKDVTYGSAKNFKGENAALKLDIYQPAGDKEKNRAAIIFVHGGGLTGGSKSEAFYTKYITEFAQRGYVVFSIDYRLRDNQDHYIDALNDAADDADSALKWVQNNSKKYGVDKNHIALVGHSVGSDIINKLCYSTRMQDKILADSIFAVTEIAGAGLTLFTANESIRNNAPPCLVIHGTMDEYIPFQDDAAFAAALKAKGIQCTFLPLQDGTHLFYDDYYEVVDTTVQFLYNQIIGFNIRKDKQLCLEELQKRRTAGLAYHAKQINFKADGILDEWGNSDKLSFNQPEKDTASLPTKDECSGTAMIGWNENDPTRIYLAVTITDDLIADYAPADGWWRWVDDTLEIRTDLSEHSALYPLLWAIGANGDLAETANSANTECKYVRNGTTTTYEIALDLSKANTTSPSSKAAFEQFKCEDQKMIGLSAFYDDTEVYRQMGLASGWIIDRLSYINLIFSSEKVK